VRKALRKSVLRKIIAVLILSVSPVVSVLAQQTWTDNFNDSDINEVIKFVADITHKTLVIDPRGMLTALPDELTAGITLGCH